MMYQETVLGRGPRMTQEMQTATVRQAIEERADQRPNVLDSLSKLGNTVSALYEIVDVLEKRLSFVRNECPVAQDPPSTPRLGGSPIRNEIENQNDRLTELYKRLVELNGELDL